MSRITILGLAVLLYPCLAGGADWHQWRGPQQTGYDPDSPPLISRLAEDGLQPLWVSDGEVPGGGGGGWSSPVVDGHRVFAFSHVKRKRDGVELPEAKYPKLTDEQEAALGKDDLDQYERARREEQIRRRELQFNWQETLFCFDAGTGRVLWTNQRESLATRFPQSGTPAVAGGQVYLHGARGAIRAVDAATGKDVWQTQLPGEFDGEHHASSVAVADGVVAVAAAGLAGLDAQTGKLLWQAESADGRSSQSSPVVWKHGKRELIVVHAGKETICIDPKDGNVQWRAQSNPGRSTPVAIGDKLITYGNSRKSGVQCFRISAERAEPLWQSTAVADEGSTPLVADGFLYVHGDKRLVCYELESGRIQWRTTLDVARPRYTSLVGGDGKIFLAAEEVLALSASPEGFRQLMDARIDRQGHLAPVAHFRRLLNLDELEQTAEGQKQAESLWRRELSGPQQCITPALSDGRLYVRLQSNRLACYDLRLSGE